jgi:hypothetical protein
MKEIAVWDSKSPLEKGFSHHDFLGVGSWNVLALGWSPLEQGPWGQEVVLNKLKDFSFVDGGGLEHFGA